MIVGGTLIVSRAAGIMALFEQHLINMGFTNVSGTCEEKDSLNMLLNRAKPRLVFLEANFYCSATPFMVGQLLHDFPKINIVVFSMSEFPDDLAMHFIFAGAKGYINLRDSYCEWRRGLKKILKGNFYISKRVKERIEMRSLKPDYSLSIPSRQLEVLKLLCNGFTTGEIGDTLQISKRTVEWHKTELYGILHVRNQGELIRIALYLGLVSVDSICFYGRDYIVPPLPEKE